MAAHYGREATLESSWLWTTPNYHPGYCRLGKSVWRKTDIPASFIALECKIQPSRVLPKITYRKKHKCRLICVSQHTDSEHNAIQFASRYDATPTALENGNRAAARCCMCPVTWLVSEKKSQQRLLLLLSFVGPWRNNSSSWKKYFEFRTTYVSPLTLAYDNSKKITDLRPNE